MISVFLLVLALGALCASDEQEVHLLRGNCPNSWYSYSNRCYKHNAVTMTWADAELHCVSEGANLVSIRSLEEHNFIKTLIKTLSGENVLTWIGLSDIHKEGRWMWSDGSQVNFEFWDQGEPNNAGEKENCAHINFGPDLKWNDLECSKTISFVCAARTVCR